MRITVRIPRWPSADLGPSMASSLIAHLAAAAGLSLLPSFLPTGSLSSAVYTVELVDLPPARAGGAAAAPERPSGPPPETEEKETPAPETKPAPVREPEPAPRKPAPPEPAARKPAPNPEKPAPPRETPAASAAASETPPEAPDAGSAQPAPAGGDAPQGAGGASGPAVAGIGEEVGAGSFDDAAFRFAYYRSLLRNALRAQWSKPLYPSGAAGDLRAVVHFFIARDGTILDLRLADSSGYPPLDLSALRAVQDVGRMPPLPQEYDKDRVGVQYIFELKPED